MMNEKTYKTMSSAGTAGLVLGIITLVTGIVTGILMIVNGARLLKEKSDILIYKCPKSHRMRPVVFRSALDRGKY